MKHKLKTKRRIAFSLILLPVIALTVFALLQPQRIQQFAQQIYSGPPLFGCLQVGEGTTDTCGTRLGKQLEQSFTLHGRPLNGQPVYYGDRLHGSLEYTNVGDLPINIKNLTLFAKSGLTDKIVTFLPGSGELDLAPGENIKIDDASYRFTHDEPRGAWSVGGVLTDKNNQSAEVDAQKSNIVVNATCTALRIQELTEKDKSNLKAHCSSNPKSKLCTSRQYCEIFKGEGCTQPNVSAETDRWQCDEYVYLPKPEQDLLEEFCKVYPDSDACKDFCDRTVGSKLCPDKYLFIDTYTGKPIKFKHPRVLFVRDVNGLKFKYSKDYPTDKARIHTDMEKVGSGSASGHQSVAGINTGPVLLADAFLKGSACGSHDCYTGAPLSVKPAPKPLPSAHGTTTQPATSVPGTTCGGARPCAPPPPPPPPIMPNCFPDMEAAKICRPESCANRDPNCEARNQKLLTFGCNKQQCDPRNSNTCGQQYVPSGGCRTVAPPAPALPVGAAPAQCGIPGSPQCNLEKNNLPPDPAKGRIADPATCTPDGKPIPPATKCTSLTVPESAVEGDLGYAKECRSGRRDVNPIDDPSGVNQFSCCANSISLREGCCGQDCGVWSQKARPDGRVEYRDGAGRVCSNRADVEVNNFCGGVDKDGVNRTRENTIPSQLNGTGGLTQKAPQGFIPGTRYASCDVQNGNCGSGLVCKSISGRQGVCEPENVGTGTKVENANECTQKGLQYNSSNGTCGTRLVENDQPVCGSVKSRGNISSSAKECCMNTCSTKSCHYANVSDAQIYCGPRNGFWEYQEGTPVASPVQAAPATPQTKTIQVPAGAIACYKQSGKTVCDNTPRTTSGTKDIPADATDVEIRDSSGNRTPIDPNYDPKQSQPQPLPNDAGVACDTRNPSTCRSGKCLPTGPDSGTNGACAAQ